MAALGAVLVTLVAPAAAQGSTGSGGQASVVVSRQDYVVDAPADPYSGDPSSIHVAERAGSELARSFVRLALGELPPGARATSGTLTLVVTTSGANTGSGAYPIYNVNTDQAILEACVLTKTLPAHFTPSSPPPYDCAEGSSVGRASRGGASWSFDLRNLEAAWRHLGNTGAAIIPIAASTGSTWSVAFYTSQSAATVGYTTSAPGTSGSSTPGARSGMTTAGQAGSLAPSMPSMPSQAVPSQAVPAQAVPAQAVPAGGPVAFAATPAPTTHAARPLLAPARQPSLVTAAPLSTARDGALPGGGARAAWPWILLSCLLAGLAIVASTHRKSLVGVVAPLGRAWKQHPRAYGSATVVTAWGVVFALYATVIAPLPTPVRTVAGGTGSGVGSTVGSASAAPAGSAATSRAGTASAGTAVTGGAATGGAAAASAGGGTATSTSAGGRPLGTLGHQAGTYRRIGNVEVFFPAGGGRPQAQLYQGAADTTGITSSSVTLCGHAALSFGPAFSLSASDLNVYWDNLNAHGGIYGRKFSMTWENDNYNPGQAVQAAQTCADMGSFMVISGIGFDQIPAVRQWAEQNHELYLYHIAVGAGSQGMRYSYTFMPTVEQIGTWDGQLAVQRFRGKKVGILYRQSPNWTPGSDSFAKVVQAAGMQVVGAYPVQDNQGNYEQDIIQLKAAGAQVVLAWENALAETEMIKQAQSQQYYPAWIVFPFNLETSSLGSAALQQPIVGVAPWDPYDSGYYGGPFTDYASYLHEFESEYHTWDPNANLSGPGGDILFATWEYLRVIGDMFRACGPNCTRDKMAGIWLAGYHATTPPNCNINFSLADQHHAGYLFDGFQVFQDPSGRAAWEPTGRCLAALGG